MAPSVVYKTLGRWEVIVGIEMEFSELDIGRIADLPVRGARAITIIRGCITAKVYDPAIPLTFCASISQSIRTMGSEN
jgi:hypothetical protein